MEKETQKNLKFPDGFYWGAATSAYQVEGGINNCDWAKVYPAGIACDHYNLYEKDFDIAKSLGHNAHRFSIEWSRIEPEKGKFDEEEIEHYRNVIKALRGRGIEPFITLWHWTLPYWVAEKGGWEKRKTIKYFERYVEKIIKELGDDIRFWITLNEPDDIYSIFSYLKGIWPPQKKSIIKTIIVLNNLIKAHKKVYKIIHQNNPSAKIGFANNVVHYESYHNTLINNFLKFLVDYFWNFWFLNWTIKYNDFIGCNYYHNLINYGFNKNLNMETSDVGWEICPTGIYYVLKTLKKYNLPIYITENGIADAKDEKRERFIKDHLYWIHKAIQEGVDVRGYFYWSLLDNFEWDKGFWPRFGLVEVDYKTMNRKVRPSAYEYAKICKENKLEI